MAAVPLWRRREQRPDGGSLRRHPRLALLAPAISVRTGLGWTFGPHRSQARVAHLNHWHGCQLRDLVFQRLVYAARRCAVPRRLHERQYRHCQRCGGRFHDRERPRQRHGFHRHGVWLRLYSGSRDRRNHLERQPPRELSRSGVHGRQSVLDACSRRLRTLRDQSAVGRHAISGDAQRGESRRRGARPSPDQSPGSL